MARRSAPNEIETFAEYLEQEMAYRHMSMREFAGFAGVDHATISRLVSGETERPSLEVVKNVSDATGITIDTLVDLIFRDRPRRSGESLWARLTAQRIEQLPDNVRDLVETIVRGHHSGSGVNG